MTLRRAGRFAGARGAPAAARRARLLLVLGAALPWLPPAAAQPAPQHGIYAPVEPNAEDEALLRSSREIEELLVRRGLRYRDGGLEAWLGAIGARLAPAPTDPYIRYRFFLLRDASPNAFALQDGQVYVHTGMLARLENEAQLAAILAHEVNHVAGHHVLVWAHSTKKKQIAATVIGGVLSAGGGPWGSLAATLQELAFVTSILGYSRALEAEADRNGLERMLSAGYDVRELPEVFRLMDEDPEGEQPRIATVWLDHPQLEDRARDLQALIDALPAETLAGLGSGEAGYAERVLPVAIMTVEDYARADYGRTALALARVLLGRHPGDPRLLVALGNAWLALGPRAQLAADEVVSDGDKRANRRERARKTREERDRDLLASPEGQANLARNLHAAGEAFRQALAGDARPAAAYRGLGEVHAGLGEPVQAARAYLSYLEAAPDAPDRAAVMTELRELTARIKAVEGDTAQ